MKVDVIMPQMGESIAEGTIAKWFKQVGDEVRRDESLLEISTDKVDAEIPSPAEGVIAEIRHHEGETVPINTVIAVIETDASQPLAAPDQADSEAAEDKPATIGIAQNEAPIRQPWEQMATESRGQHQRRIRSSPLVRRLAREHNIDLRLISGTGISGRVTKRDVIHYLENRTATQIPLPQTPVEPPAVVPAYQPEERVEIVPMSQMRKTIAERMIQSRRTAAHVTTVFEVDMTRVVRLRESLKDEFAQQYGVRLTYTAFIAQACIGALKAFPIFNASLSNDHIIYKKDINLGIAVALDWGLIVPVVKNADEKSLLGLAKAIQELADHARQKRLTPEAVQGGTFTITNPGVFGSLFGTPIINQPQVAILGVGAIVKRPVIVNDDAIAVRSMAYLALSFDHRLIDGAAGDQFMSHIKRLLESSDLATVR
jgi:2-oxoglutarate dehydrogenase E2 component (dihydrolipoamide succinyltransferase)